MTATREWTLCTVHGRVVSNGSCDECDSGDRNLIQVVPKAAPGDFAPEHFVIHIDRDGYGPASVAVCQYDSARVIGANVLAAVQAMRRTIQ